MTAATPPATEQAGWRSRLAAVSAAQALAAEGRPLCVAGDLWQLRQLDGSARGFAISELPPVRDRAPEETGQHLARGVVEGWLVPERVAGMYRLSLPLGWQGSWEGYRGAAGLLLVDEAEGGDLAS